MRWRVWEFTAIRLMHICIWSVDILKALPTDYRLFRHTTGLDPDLNSRATTCDVRSEADSDEAITFSKFNAPAVNRFR